MSLTLHFHPLSSFCHKVLIALYENDTPFTPQVVNLMDEGERAAFREVWPIGKFPVLRDDARGETVPESSVVIEYLDRRYPGRTRFIPSDGEDARKVRLGDRFFDLYIHLPMQKIVGDRLRPADGKDPHGVEEALAQPCLPRKIGVLRDEAGFAGIMPVEILDDDARLRHHAVAR